MEPLPLSIVILALVALSAFFSSTETAYSCANKIKLKSMITLGKKNAKAVYKFADEGYDKLVTAILVGNNIVNLTASALGTILFSKLIADQNLAATVSTAVLTVLVLLFGEITPKYLASVYPEKFCFFVYPLMTLFYWLLWPICKIFDGFKWCLAKIFKLRKDETVTDEELKSLVDEAEESGTLKEDESELLRSALEFDDLKVEDILVPRVDVYAVEEESTMEEVLEVFRKTGYSRLPVYKETIDNVVGLIHERDFFVGYLKGETNIGHLIQDIAFTSEYTRISSLLKQLQKQKIHMAAVSDEYGGLVGIVTLEDILEELVGEIWDEDDRAVRNVVPMTDGSYSVNPEEHVLDVLDELGLDYSEEEEEEIGRKLMNELAYEVFPHIPVAGDSFRYLGMKISVLVMRHNRIMRLKVRRLTETELEADAADALAQKSENGPDSGNGGSAGRIPYAVHQAPGKHYMRPSVPRAGRTTEGGDGR